MGVAIPLKVELSPPRDQRGRVLTDLRISVVDRCNFRCPYCMPEDQYPRDHEFLSKAERLRFEEIERLATIFAGLGVRKLRLTGGEPLLRRDLPELVRKLAAVPGIDDIALTTNGSLLTPHVDALRAAGLKRITLSIDTIVPETFRAMSGGRGDIGTVLEAIAAAERAGFGPLKLNCVVMRGTNDGEIVDLVERFRGSGHIVRFIEYMDVGNRNHWTMDRVVPSRELVERIAQRWPLHPVDPNYRGEVAERYAFDDGVGEVGFISSITNPFCGDCTRARLSSEGVLYTCLFARSGVDLRAPLRKGATDAELSELISSTWLQRGDRYSEIRSSLQNGEQPLRKIEMYYIGG
jgi:cyclic pyranopterin phosphate synthase